MNFPTDYFEDEVRDGFYVPSMIKRAWASQVEVLKEVTDICDRHGIRFFADWGTMLGAVRHGGFIPWDDDLDILMLRKDYEKFLKVAPKELPERYQINNVHNWEGFDNVLTRINNTQYVCLEKEFLEKYQNYPCSTGLDIFVIDYLPRDPQMQKELKETIEILLSLKAKIDDVPTWEKEEYLQPVEEALKVHFDRSKSLPFQMGELCETVCSMYTEEESDCLTCMTLWSEAQAFYYPKDCFDHRVFIPFENFKIPVPAGYDRLLGRKYGNYMHLVKDHTSHNYPYFAKQYKELREQIVKLPEYHPTQVPAPRNADMRAQKTRVECEKMLAMLEQARHLQAVAVQEGREADVAQLENSCNLLTEKVESLLTANENRKHIIVFLPARARWWPGMESLWRAESADPNNIVYVMPVPFYHKNGLGEVVETCYEGNAFPDDVPVVDYNAINLEELHPDEMIVQVPFDEYNPDFMVHPYFYVSHLRDMTDQLVYVPYFKMDPVTSIERRAILLMPHYVVTPGVVLSDYVLLPDEETRDRYLEVLGPLVDAESVESLQQKLLPVGSPWDEYDATSSYRDNMPEELIGRKVVGFHVGLASMLEKGENFFAKLERVLDTFAQQKERIRVLWIKDSSEPEKGEYELQRLTKRLERIQAEFEDSGLGVLVEDMERARLIAWSDAYYGDACALPELYRVAGKPVMLMNFEV